MFGCLFILNWSLLLDKARLCILNLHRHQDLHVWLPNEQQNGRPIRNRQTKATDEHTNQRFTRISLFCCIQQSQNCDNQFWQSNQVGIAKWQEHRFSSSLESCKFELMFWEGTEGVRDFGVSKLQSNLHWISNHSN